MVIDPINDKEGTKKTFADSKIPSRGFGSPSDGVISTTLGGEPQNPLLTKTDSPSKPVSLNNLSGVHKYLDNANKQYAEAQAEKQANHDKSINAYASLYKDTPAFNGATANGNQESNSEKSNNADANPTKQGDTQVTPASDVSAPSSQPQQVNEGTSAPKDKLAELQAKYGIKGNTETPKVTEPKETGDRNIV